MKLVWNPEINPELLSFLTSAVRFEQKTDEKDTHGRDSDNINLVECLKEFK